MTSPAITKKSKSRELDTANANRGIWLVKVPNYLADIWKDASPTSGLGTIKITNSKNPTMTFTLSEELAVKAKEKMKLDSEVPRQHRVITQDTTKQSLCVFSEASESKKLAAEGKVTQRADFQPVDSAAYMKLKQHQIKAAGRTKFNPVVQLDQTPVVKPAKNVTAPKQLDKRARDDRDEVLDRIFTAFHSFEFYTFKDLVHTTKQPPTYLKEILKEVCIYNTRAPHKNMWQLKPEFRHYKKP